MPETKAADRLEGDYYKEVVGPAFNLAILAFNRTLVSWSSMKEEDAFYDPLQSAVTVQNIFLDVLISSPREINRREKEIRDEKLRLLTSVSGSIALSSYLLSDRAGNNGSDWHRVYHSAHSQWRYFMGADYLPLIERGFDEQTEECYQDVRANLHLPEQVAARLESRQNEVDSLVRFAGVVSRPKLLAAVLS